MPLIFRLILLCGLQEFFANDRRAELIYSSALTTDRDEKSRIPYPFRRRVVKPAALRQRHTPNQSRFGSNFHGWSASSIGTSLRDVRFAHQSLRDANADASERRPYHQPGSHHAQIDSTYAAEPSRCQASSCAWSFSCWPRARGTTAKTLVHSGSAVMSPQSFSNCATGKTSSCP